MKKYLFGSLAVVLAIAFSAFTKPASSPNTIYTVKFSGDPLIKAQVEDIAKWDLVSAAPCTNFSQQDLACTLEVSDQFTHFDNEEGIEVLNTPSTVPTGEQVLSITAALSGFNSYYKVSSASSTVTIHNGSNR